MTFKGKLGLCRLKILQNNIFGALPPDEHNFIYDEDLLPQLELFFLF